MNWSSQKHYSSLVIVAVGGNFRRQLLSKKWNKAILSVWGNISIIGQDQINTVGEKACEIRRMRKWLRKAEKDMLLFTLQYQAGFI